MLWLKETWLEKQKCFFSVTPQNGGLKNDKTHLNIDNSWFTNYIGGHKFSAQAKCSRKLEFLTHWQTLCVFWERNSYFSENFE